MQNPIAIATQGLAPRSAGLSARQGFLFSDEKGGSASPSNSWRKKWKENYERQAQQTEQVELPSGEVVEVDGAPKYKVVPQPIETGAQPVSALNGIDKELAIELRKTAIREHAEAIAKELKERKRFREELSLMLILTEV